jgi:hypothetical protein
MLACEHNWCDLPFSWRRHHSAVLTVDEGSALPVASAQNRDHPDWAHSKDGLEPGEPAISIRRVEGRLPKRSSCLPAATANLIVPVVINTHSRAEPA